MNKGLRLSITYIGVVTGNITCGGKLPTVVMGAVMVVECRGSPQRPRQQGLPLGWASSINTRSKWNWSVPLLLFSGAGKVGRETFPVQRAQRDE